MSWILAAFLVGSGSTFHCLGADRKLGSAVISVTQTDIDAGCLFLGACIFIAAMRQGFKTMASAIEQVGQALAGAHSAAFEQLEADIQLAATQLATKDARITELEGLLAAATAGTSDADLGTLDALLKPALDAVAPAAPPAATATPVTVPDNPPPAATAGPAVANTPAVS